MQNPHFTQILHQPLRLAIVVHLHQHGEDTLARIRARLDDHDHAPDVRCSPQLARAHAALLTRAGLIEARIERGKAIIKLTDDGREALAAHRAALLRFIPAMSANNAIEAATQ
jgi:hypothetical protein